MQHQNSTHTRSIRESQVVKNDGPPAHVRAHRQLSRAFHILRSAGNGGVNRERFINSIENGGFGITQIASRNFELRRMGCVIDSFRANPSDVFVSYRLISSPADIQERLDRREGYRSQKKKTDDWYTAQTGKSRHSDDTSDLPLFAGVRQ
jgi:hypothetical protein